MDRGLFRVALNRSNGPRRTGSSRSVEPHKNFRSTPSAGRGGEEPKSSPDQRDYSQMGESVSSALIVILCSSGSLTSSPRT